MSRKILQPSKYWQRSVNIPSFIVRATDAVKRWIGNVYVFDCDIRTKQSDNNRSYQSEWFIVNHFHFVTFLSIFSRLDCLPAENQLNWSKRGNYWRLFRSLLLNDCIPLVFFRQKNVQVKSNKNNLWTWSGKQSRKIYIFALTFVTFVATADANYKRHVFPRQIYECILDLPLSVSKFRRKETTNERWKSSRERETNFPIPRTFANRHKSDGIHFYRFLFLLLDRFDDFSPFRINFRLKWKRRERIVSCLLVHCVFRLPSNLSHS